MNRTEKLVLLQGAAGPAIGNTAPIERLGVPALRLEDGPNGVADWQQDVTAFPSSLTAVASWDVALVAEYAQAQAVEQRGKGMHVMLGPGVNLARVPQGGRNFEYMSGEDPVLGAKMVGPAIAAIQAQGVVANAKHFAMNSQETHRMTISEDVDERTRFELYYPPFEAAIAAGVGSFMCSYTLADCPGHIADCGSTLGSDFSVNKFRHHEYFTLVSFGSSNKIPLKTLPRTPGRSCTRKPASVIEHPYWS